MKKSEELMLLLAYNKKEVPEYRLRKQLSYELNHPNTLLFHASLEELFRMEYGINTMKYYQMKNPLMYHNSWPKELTSIRQFYVQTKDSNRIVSIDEIIEHPSYNGIGLKRILQDIFATYIEEYNKAFLSMLKQLKKAYYLLPKNTLLSLKKYRKKVVISFLIFFVLLALYLLPWSQIIHKAEYLEVYQNIFHNSSILSTVFFTIGRLSILFYLVFFMVYYAYRSRKKEVHSIEHIHRDFDEELVVKNHQKHIDKSILNIQLFIEKVEDKSKQDIDLLKAFDYEDKMLKNYTTKLAQTHRKNDLLLLRESRYISTMNKAAFFANITASIFFLYLIVQLLLEVL